MEGGVGLCMHVCACLPIAPGSSAGGRGGIQGSRGSARTPSAASMRAGTCIASHETRLGPSPGCACPYLRVVTPRGVFQRRRKVLGHLQQAGRGTKEAHDGVPPSTAASPAGAPPCTLAAVHVSRLCCTSYGSSQARGHVRFAVFSPHACSTSPQLTAKAKGVLARMRLRSHQPWKATQLESTAPGVPSLGTPGSSSVPRYLHGQILDGSTHGRRGPSDALHACPYVPTSQHQ